MAKHYFTPIVVGLLATAGCTTHLEVDRARADLPESRQGIAYFLPFSQFETTVTWFVADCTNGLEIGTRTEAAARSARDPEHLYTIDYSSLDAWTKTSSVKVDFYDSGAIKSINAAADDRTAEIATKLVSAAGELVKFAGVGAAVASLPCSTDLKEAVKAVRKAKGALAPKTAQLEYDTAALQAQSVRIVRGGDATSPDALRVYDEMIAKAVASQMELDIAKRQLAAAMKKISHSETVLFPATSSQSKTTEGLLIARSTFSGWSGITTDALLTAYLQDYQVYLAVTSAGGWPTGKDFDPAKRSYRLAGVRYRIGVPGTLLACMGAPCDAKEKHLNVDEIPVIVLQSGTTFYLPFASAPFSNGGLTATFAENGVLTSAGYEQKRARGEAIAGVADSLADQIVSTGTAIREARTTKLERIKEQIELTKAQNELAVAQRTLDASPNSVTEQASAALVADTALKQAEIANIEMEIALRRAREARDAAGGTP